MELHRHLERWMEFSRLDCLLNDDDGTGTERIEIIS